MNAAAEGRRPGWRSLAGGSWLLDGKTFADDRGTSRETFDLDDAPVASLGAFAPTQENLVTTFEAGCARGLHFQIGGFAQAKLVTVLRGSAQFLWLQLDQRAAVAEVHSVILGSTAQSLFTPGNCAHGFLALEDNTQVLLKMSHPVTLAQRGEIRLLSDDLSISFARPIREELLSTRDRAAPHWSPRL